MTTPSWRNHMKTAYNNLKSVLHFLNESHNEDLSMTLLEVNDNSTSEEGTSRSPSTFEDTSGALNSYFSRVHNGSDNTTSSGSSPQMNDETMGIVNESFHFDIDDDPMEPIREMSPWSLNAQRPEDAEMPREHSVITNSPPMPDEPASSMSTIENRDINQTPDWAFSAFNGESNLIGLSDNSSSNDILGSNIAPHSSSVDWIQHVNPQEFWAQTSVEDPNVPSTSSRKPVLIRVYRVYRSRAPERINENGLIEQPPASMEELGVESAEQDANVGQEREENLFQSDPELAPQPVLQQPNIEYSLRREDPVQFHLDAFDSPPPSPTGYEADYAFNMQVDPNGVIPDLENLVVSDHMEGTSANDVDMIDHSNKCPLDLCKAFWQFMDTTPDNVKDKQALLKEMFQNIYQLVRTAAMEAPGDKMEEIVEISASVTLINNSFGSNASMESFQGISETARYVVMQVMTAIEKTMD